MKNLTLQFFWRDRLLDVLDVDVDNAAPFVSIQAPKRLAFAAAEQIEAEVAAVDAAGRRWSLSVERIPWATDDVALAQYPSINGYLRRPPG